MWPLLNSLPRSPTLKKHLCSISVVSTLFCAHLFENTVTVLSLSLTVWVCLLCVRLKNGGNALKCFSWARASAFSSTSASGASLYFCSAILFFTWVWASFLVLFMYFIHFPLWVLIISPCYLKILDF